MSHLTKIRPLLAGTLILAATPMASHAASGGSSSVTFPTKPRVSYAAPISQLSQIDPSIKSRVLNWSQPTLELTFDLTEADLFDGLELLLTADPLGRVSKSTPISVQFNNDTPVRISTRGQGFDSRIRLDPSKVRARNNKIRITYETPRGSDCVLPEHGGWLIDLKHSKLAVKGRAKSRALQLREVEMRLDLPAMAPRRVGVIANGPDATALQSLAAQGIGLRMDHIPNFTTRKGAGDFEIIMARRDQLHAYTRDKAVLDSTGPRLYVPRGRPMRLVITGDTDAQLLEAVKSFASFNLPKSRRQLTSLGEMRMQPFLGAHQARIEGTSKLSDLSGYQYGTSWKDDDWASRPQALRFSVSDPAATTGEVILKLSAGQAIAPESKLRVSLNGELLGTAQLDSARQTASFEITPGALHGVDNVLTLTPELKPGQVSGCASSAVKADFHLGGGSKITLSQSRPSPITDLSRMAATGAPFSDHYGRETYIAMPKAAANFNAGLKIIAQLAKVSGKGLVEADYGKGSAAAPRDHHILAIDDRRAVDPALRQSAPSAFTQALKGRAISGSNLVSAAYGQYADVEGLIALQAAARQHAKMSRVNAGGVATLFGSNADHGRIIGIITNTPGQSFTRAADQLAESGHWNQLEGGVARWNAKSVLLAQTAADVPGYQGPVKMPKMADLPSLSELMAEFEMPEFNLPSGAEVKAFGANTVANIKSGFAGLMSKDKMSKDKTGHELPQIQQAASSSRPAYGEAPRSGRVQADVPRRERITSAAYSGQPLIPQPASQSIPALRGPIAVKPFEADWKADIRARLDTAKIWSQRRIEAIQSWVERQEFEQSISRFQDRLRPYGSQIKAKLKLDQLPEMKALQWGGQTISAPALMLLLGFAVFLILMGLARPLLRKGGRH